MLTFPSLLHVARPASVARLTADADRLFAGGLQSANYPQIGLWANEEEAIVRAELPGLGAASASAVPLTAACAFLSPSMPTQ